MPAQNDGCCAAQAFHLPVSQASYLGCFSGHDGRENLLCKNRSAKAPVCGDIACKQNEVRRDDGTEEMKAAGDVFDLPRKRGKSRLVSVKCARDDFGRRQLVRSRIEFAVVTDQSTRGCDGLPAPTLPTPALQSFQVQTDVAELSSHTLGTGYDATFTEDGTADALGYRDEHRIAGAANLSEPKFREQASVCGIINLDVHVEPL